MPGNVKVHKITRQYWSKKQSRVITKTYEYISKSRRGATLVGKNGKIYRKNIDKLEDAIRNDTTLTAAEKRTKINDIEAKVKQRHKAKQKMTTTGYYGELENNAISRMLVNAGYSSEEAALELGISEADLLDENNWQGNKLTVGSQSWDFVFTYSGQMWR